MPVLRARGIAKAFGGSRALDSVDLDVPAGRVLGLIGQNRVAREAALETLRTEIELRKLGTGVTEAQTAAMRAPGIRSRLRTWAVPMPPAPT